METKIDAQSSDRRLNIFSFVTPSKVQRVSYKNCKRQLAHALQRNADFEDGILLDTMEKGVWYPIIHLASLSSPRVVSPKQLIMNSNALGQDYVLQQGIYQEVRAIVPETEIRNPFEAMYLNKRKEAEDVAPVFMLIGFNGLSGGLRDVLEDTWKDWTGARYLYLHLPEKFGLSRITLYRRLLPSDVTLFSYILLAECSNITRENQVFLLDFVQRFRAQRGQGFLSAYRETSLASSSSADSAFDHSSIASGSDVGSDDSAVRFKLD